VGTIGRAGDKAPRRQEPSQPEEGRHWTHGASSASSTTSKKPRRDTGPATFPVFALIFALTFHALALAVLCTSAARPENQSKVNPLTFSWSEGDDPRWIVMQREIVLGRPAPSAYLGSARSRQQGPKL